MMVTGTAALLLPLLVLVLVWWGWGVRRTRMRGPLPPGPTPLPLLGNLLQLESDLLDHAFMELSVRRPAPCTGTVWIRSAAGRIALRADTFSGSERFTRGNSEPRSTPGGYWIMLYPMLPVPWSSGIAMARDPEFLRLLDLFNDNFRTMSSRWGKIYNVFPSLLAWLPRPHHRIFQNLAELQVFVSEQIQQHRQTQQPRIASSTKWGQQDPESHFQEETVMMMHNPYFSGTEATSTTLCYGLLILLKYPEVAAKVQAARLDAVVGQKPVPSLEDLLRLPYTNTMLHKIQHFNSVLLLGLQHTLTRQAHLHSHFLPKGTFVIPLLVSAHQDPTQFKDPDCFNHTDFLDDKGEFLSNDTFMPFAPGPGSRMCLGTDLAHSEIFLFLTAILQTLPAPCGDATKIVACTGLDNVPSAFQLCLVAC